MPAPPDPYRVLGVSPSASEAEIRSAYRRLVQLHHPDHNAGSADAARRFELVQEAYAEVRRRRAQGDA
ncbi:MAG: J domain-containing protein, partial [Solirubrobacteraceae bacterium]